MNPNPNLRYQTADEMLNAFQRLHRDDPRAVSHRRRCALITAFCILTFLIGGMTAFVGQERLKRLSDERAAAEASVTFLRNGDVDQALDSALKALPESRGILDPADYIPRAQRALANALGVYNISDGYQAHKRIALTSKISQEAVKPVKANLSPDGSLTAVLVNELENWWIQVYDANTGEAVIDALEAQQSPTSDFIFIDNTRLLYAGKNGLTLVDLSTGRELWTTGQAATHIALSADGAVAATICRDDTSAFIWNAQTGEFLREVGFNGRHLRFLTGDTLIDPDDNLFALDASGQWMAVSFSDGSASFYNLNNDTEDAIFDAGELDCTHFEGGFCSEFLAVAASGGSRSVFILIDLANMRLANFSENPRAFHIQADESGIYLSRPALDVISKINPYAQTEEEVLERRLCALDSEIVSFKVLSNRTLVNCKDGKWLLFDENANQIAELSAPAAIDYAAFGNDSLLIVNRNVSALFVQKWERHPETTVFSYDPALYHSEANIHTNGETAVLFWRNDFKIIDRSGALITSVEIPDVNQMRDQQYRRIGETDRLGNTVSQDYLEIWYFDGLVRAYSMENGILLFEEQGPIPDDLGASRQRNEEIMETEDFRVVSSLNGTPYLYDKKSGEALGTLDADAMFLMYIYQIEDNIIAQYMANDGSRFGLLINRNCEILADIPNLTDVLPDNTLIIDDNLGNLRQCRVYSIEELIHLGRQQKEANE